MFIHSINNMNCATDVCCKKETEYCSLHNTQLSIIQDIASQALRVVLCDFTLLVKYENGKNGVSPFTCSGMKTKEVAEKVISVLKSMADDATRYNFMEIVHQYATKYEISSETLRSAIRSHPQYKLCEHGNRKLSDEQELIFASYLVLCSDIRKPIPKAGLAREAEIIFGVNFGRGWAREFLKRWSNVVYPRNAELVKKKSNLYTNGIRSTLV